MGPRLSVLAVLLTLLAPSFGAKKKAKGGRHDLEIVEFIRNASSAHSASGKLHAEHSRSSIDSSKRVISIDRSAESATKATAVETSNGDAEEEDLRHADLITWKKKKREARLALKASGAPKEKKLGQAGTTTKDFDELEEEVRRGGRIVRAPCSPPHCSFRCHTDAPCRAHPILTKWRPPGPRVCDGRKIYPISFGIPASEVVECVPFKSNDFATVVPYREKSYVFGPADEAEYKRDYRKARFGITRKKEGWDCMRHYEILASGSVPMFLDIDKAPPGVMAFLPRDLLQHVRHQPHFWVKGCDMRHTLGECHFGLYQPISAALPDYDSIACSLLEHTKKHLTTRAMALYALKAAGKIPEGTERAEDIPRDFRALYVGGTAHNSDYLRDLMMHGFRDLLGDRLFEYNTPRYMYAWPSDTPSNSAAANPNKHWGMGFSVARRLDYYPRTHLRNQTIAVDLILAKYFDVVIFGNAHRGDRISKPPSCWRGVLLTTCHVRCVPPGMPLWSAVSKAKYPQSDILAFNGEDWHAWKQVETQHKEFRILDRATYFLRELPDGCPSIQAEP